MDHRAFLAGMDPEVTAALTQRSTARGLLHLMGHLGLLVFGGIWIAVGWPLWWAAMLPYGIALVFLFTLEHECTHQTPFAHVGLNEWVGRLVGVVLFLPFGWFRYFHLAHHRHTNIPGKDPELGSDKPQAGWPLVWHVSGLPLWGRLFAQLFRNAFGVIDAEYVPERARPRVAQEARIYLGVYAALALSFVVSPVLLWVWLLPMLLGQPFLRLYLLAEHGRCTFVANMFENTRTTFTNRVVRFLAWNMPYHAEHHVQPNVPFHRLPEFHGYVQAHLHQTSEGYGAFLKSYVGR